MQEIVVAFLAYVILWQLQPTLLRYHLRGRKD